MSELTLFVLRFGFLALLWVFVFAIVFALRSDLFGHYVRRADLKQGDIAVNPQASGSSFLPPLKTPKAPNQRAPSSSPLALGKGLRFRLTMTPSPLVGAHSLVSSSATNTPPPTMLVCNCGTATGSFKISVQPTALSSTTSA